MGEKSQQKRKYIVEKARQVFVEKGYRSVTMKDIIDACEISRGGLYLYFSSTQEIFLEVLSQDAEAGEDVFGKTLNEKSTPLDVLQVFLDAQKAELMGMDQTLAMATYEYAFAHQLKGKENFVKEKFRAAVRALEQLLSQCAKRGEVYCDDPAGMARQIMYTIEGMKVSMLSMKPSEAEIEEQFTLIWANLGLILEEEPA
ncbi:MAG: TetR/AcrR family transcriptional regulator [Lachnospiraceae bacterium]|nr:TetR/AcrR family transcriptional regulator [Lachnospiraceae bacterium]